MQATDNGTPNLSGSTTVVVNVTDANDPPAPTGGPFSIAENSANGTDVGTPIAANDQDTGQTHTWSITAGNTGGAFAIDGAGQITVANSAALNFETNPTFNLTVQATDNGTPNLAGSATVVVNLTDVNEAPAPSGGPFSIAENSANGTNVGTPVAANDPDTGQTHTWAITAGNTGGAFAIDSSGQITVASSAALDFETNPTFNLTVQATDNGTPVLSGSTTVVVNLTNVNEAPAPSGGPFSIAENSANGTNVGTPIAPNDPDVGQTHTWAITAGNTGGAFAINSSGQITVANSAAVDFETTPTFNLTVQATDNGSPILSGSTTVVINLTNANEPPAPSGGPFSIAENSANSTNVGTPIAPNDPDTGQTHTWAITAGNTGGAFAIDSSGQITVANSAALNFETTPTFNLTVQATDNGSPILSGSGTVVVNLTDVNEAPAPSGGPFSIAENSANSTNVGTPVAANDPDTGQTHTWAITAGNTGGAFAINSSGQISVANSAALNFETTPTFNLTVQATDNGSPVLSGSTTVVVNLTNVNEAPTAVPDTADINEEAPNVAAANTVGGNVLANDTDPDVPDTKTVTAVNGAGANVGNNVAGTFGMVNIASNGAFTYTLDDNNVTVNALAPGGTLTDTFNYTMQDGGALSSGPVNLTVTIHGADDPATPDNDGWDFIGNTEIEVDRDTAGTPEVIANTPPVPAALGVLDGDVDPDGGPPITISGIVTCADLTAPFDCVLAGQGTVSLQGDGSLSFIPEPGDTDGTATFQYTLTGNPNPATVTFTRFERVWYVNPAAGTNGTGLSSSPFNTLAVAIGVGLNGGGGGGDSDLVNDYIYVHAGTLAGAASLIELEANQHLIGKGFGLSIPVGLNGNPSPTVLDAAGAKPQLQGTGGSDTVILTTAIPVEIRGLSLQAGTNRDAIELTTAAALTGSSTLTIDNNEYRGAGEESIDVNLNAGTTTPVGGFNLDITNNNWTGAVANHTLNAVDVNRAAGTLNLNFSTNTGIRSAAAAGAAVNIVGGAAANTTITGFSSNTVDMTSAGAGIVVSNVTFDATPGGVIQPVAGGTTTIGTAGDRIGGAGLSLATVTGALNFGTDLNVFSDTGAALSVAGVAPFDFDVNPNAGDLVANAGPAASISGADINLQLNSLASATSSSGVSLTSVSGTFSAPSGASITKASGGGAAFVVDNSAAGTTVLSSTYAGTMNNSSGTGRSVLVNNADSGSTVAFSGQVTDTGQGISLTANTGATLSFSGGLALTTGANTAFSATGGGTLTVCDENPCGASGSNGALVNTITTTTGTGLNVVNTTIGASNLELRSVNAGSVGSRPTNGIVVNNTGALGGLKVKANGGTCSSTPGSCTGGTIESTTSDGVFLNLTTNPSLTNMAINNAADSGVFVDAVSGLSLANLYMDSNGAQAEGGTVQDSGIHIEDLIGAANTITNSTIQESRNTNLDWDPNSSSGQSTLTVSNTNLNHAGEGVVGQGNAGLNLTATGTANVKLVLSSGQIINNAAAGILVTGGSGTTVHTDIDAVNMVE